MEEGFCRTRLGWGEVVVVGGVWQRLPSGGPGFITMLFPSNLNSMLFPSNLISMLFPSNLISMLFPSNLVFRESFFAWC